MDAVPDATKWHVWFTEPWIIPMEYHYIVGIISWIFTTLGLAIILPIALLFAYDFILWICRLAAANRRAARPIPRTSGALGMNRSGMDESPNIKKTNTLVDSSGGQQQGQQGNGVRMRMQRSHG